jgi:hypothetical protein
MNSILIEFNKSRIIQYKININDIIKLLPVVGNKQNKVINSINDLPKLYYLELTDLEFFGILDDIKFFPYKNLILKIELKFN